jgi:hypothetical protein
MDVSSFFSRLVQPAKGQGVLRQIDDLDEFDTAWQAVKVGSYPEYSGDTR